MLDLVFNQRSDNYGFGDIFGDRGYCSLTNNLVFVVNVVKLLIPNVVFVVNVVK